MNRMISYNTGIIDVNENNCFYYIGQLISLGDTTGMVTDVDSDHFTVQMISESALFKGNVDLSRPEPLSPDRVKSFVEFGFSYSGFVSKNSSLSANVLASHIVWLATYCSFEAAKKAAASIIAAYVNIGDKQRLESFAYSVNNIFGE